MLFASSVSLIAQEQEATIFDEATIIYKKSLFGGAVIHTNGWGAHITIGRNKTAFKSRIYQLDIMNMKHPKEIRSLNAFYDDSRSYIYGKLNSFILLRPTIGTRTVKFDKIRTSGVAVGYTWRVGPVLGFTKPVYLEIISPGPAQFNQIVVERYDPEAHTANNIYGRAGGLRGFNELKLIPGLHGAFGINFEYDPKREGLKGIEVGATVDYFPLKPVEIMAYATNHQLFVNFYINLQFGSKYND